MRWRNTTTLDRRNRKRTLAWVARYRRLAIRDARRADSHQAFLDLARAHICLNFLRRDGFR